jgi:hypothetical protein
MKNYEIPVELAALVLCTTITASGLVLGQHGRIWLVAIIGVWVPTLILCAIKKPIQNDY